MVNIIPDPIKLFNNENTNKIVLFIFLKFSKSSKTENFKDYLLKKKINTVHWFICQYTNIGRKDYWTNAIIIEFENKIELQKAYENKIKVIDIEAVQVFNLFPKNPPRLLINFLKLFRPIGFFLELINSSRKELQNLENSNSNLLPTKKQAERIINEKSNEKAFMINLLQSRKTAKYKDSSISISGREAYYEKYGEIEAKCVILLGGDITYSGRILGDTLIEYNVPLDTKGNWEAIGIIEYPKAIKMLDLEKMPGYSKALVHREAGLEKTYNLYATKN
jgi:ATP-dependent Zn protease